MTKTEYRKYRANWDKQLKAGRVISYNDGISMKAFPNNLLLDTWCAEAKANGIKYEIVNA